MADPRDPWNIHPAKKRATVTAAIKAEVSPRPPEGIRGRTSGRVDRSGGRIGPTAGGLEGPIIRGKM
jgi:hypothetical protein